MTDHVTVIEWVQFITASLGVCISGVALTKAMMDIARIIKARINGINGFVSFVRLRREIFQFLSHGILALSGLFIILMRVTVETTEVNPANLSILYNRNVSMTILSLFMVANTLLDNLERHFVSDLEYEKNRRKDDPKIGDTHERSS